MPQLVVSAIENFALLLVLAFAVANLLSPAKKISKLGAQIAVGVLFGLASTVSMSIPVIFTDGIIYDSRAVLITLAGPFGGIFSPLIVGIITGAFRLYLGGIGATVDVASLVIPILFGMFLVRYPLGDDRKLRFSKLALCGIVVGVVSAPTALLLPDKKLGLELLQSLILTLPFILMCAFPIADLILNMQIWYRKAEASLQQSEEALKDAQKMGHFGNWELDVQTQKSIWSDEVYRLFEREPALGPPVFEEIVKYFRLESRERLTNQVDQAIKYGQEYEDDYSLTLPSGRNVHYFATIRTIKDDTGKVMKLVGTIQDITERKNAEENLRMIEEQRRALFKSIPVPIYCWRQIEDDFELFDYNEAALVMTDGKITDYLGLRYSVVYAARPDLQEDIKRCFAFKETITKENRHNFVTTGRMQDQIITFVYCPPDVVMVMAEDVTDKLKTSLDLELSEQRFRDFAKTAADDLWETNAEHRFTYFSSDFSEEFSPMLGQIRWETDGIDGQNPAWEVHRQDLEARRPFRDFRYTRVDINGRRRFLRINGIPIFDENGEFEGYRGTTFDETDEIEAREAARSAQESFGEAMENISDGILLWGADGHLIMRNSRFLEMYPDMADATRPGTSSKAFLYWLAERGYSQTDEHGVKYELGQGFNFNSVIERVTDDGRLYRIRREVLANGQAIVFHTDVTEQKHREEQLHHALKMEAVGQLTGGIAHDFNNILSAVLGNLELLQQKLSADQNLLKHISRSKVSVLRGAELTRRLLAFSRKQNLDPKPVYLNELIAGMYDLLTRSLGEHIAVENFSAEDLWSVRVDINQMENAILNLSINARDAMLAGGDLTIECENLSAAEFAKLNLADAVSGEYVCIKISDTGHGISPDNLERVFEPFFTTKDVGRGSGLGLSMVYGFVTQSGGWLKIESMPVEGTRVYLYLPKYEGVVPRQASVESGQNLFMGHGENVLVVEDDPDVREMTISMLSRLGYIPYDCGNGQRLMKMKADDIRKFDMLLSDVVLPNGISGPIIAQHAKEQAPKIKVILMTGYADRSELLDENENALFQVIGKPFQVDEFSRILSDTLHHGE